MYIIYFQASNHILYEAQPVAVFLTKSECKACLNKLNDGVSSNHYHMASFND